MEYAKRIGHRINGNKIELTFEKQKVLVEIITHDMVRRSSLKGNRG